MQCLEGVIASKQKSPAHNAIIIQNIVHNDQPVMPNFQQILDQYNGNFEFVNLLETADLQVNDIILI